MSELLLIMESELSDFSTKSHADESRAHVSGKDERPLLKFDSAIIRPLNHVVSDSVQELDKKFAAFARKDVYGTMGKSKLCAKEKVMLGIALFTLVPLRLIFGLAILILYYLICRLCTLFFLPYKEDEQEDYAHMIGWRRTVIVQCGKFLSRAMLFTLGFYWINMENRGLPSCDSNVSKNEANQVSDDSERPGAIVSNHVSYLDILYHMSTSFPSFVAKRSVARLPLVGLISKCLGCLYVQRESKTSDCKGVSGLVMERIKTAHENRDAPLMMLFPEGTTTNGDFLLPFRTGAFLSKTPVVPVILRYPYQRFSPAWDSISGMRHVLILLCQFVNHMEVIRLPIYFPSEQEKDDPKLYANNVRALMAGEGNLTLSDIALAEKRIYHAMLNGLLCQG